MKSPGLWQIPIILALEGPQCTLASESSWASKLQVSERTFLKIQDGKWQGKMCGIKFQAAPMLTQHTKAHVDHIQTSYIGFYTRNSSFCKSWCWSHSDEWLYLGKVMWTVNLRKQKQENRDRKQSSHHGGRVLGRRETCQKINKAINKTKAKSSSQSAFLFFPIYYIKTNWLEFTKPKVCLQTTNRTENLPRFLLPGSLYALSMLKCPPGS